jgi:uncharacterized membrane-anchored protein
MSSHPIRRLAALVALILLAFTARVARADDAASDSSAPAPSGAPADKPLPWQPGPATIDLGKELVLELPDKDLFLAPPDAARLLEKGGTLHNENLLGIVVPMSDDEHWFVTIRYEPEGYVKDDDKVDADELLKALREGNDEANEERKEKGFPPLALDGWSDPPRYDRAPHHLIWGLIVSSEGEKSINYNTRVLGRRGWVAVNLVTDPATIEKFKPEGRKVLDNTKFKPGARYEDFDKKTDKVAEYGLIGLVLGGAGLGAAKLVKIGLLAKFWKVIVAGLIAGKKAIAVAAMAVVAFVKKIFGRKKLQEE